MANHRSRAPLLPHLGCILLPQPPRGDLSHWRRFVAAHLAMRPPESVPERYEVFSVLQRGYDRVEDRDPQSFLQLLPEAELDGAPQYEDLSPVFLHRSSPLFELPPVGLRVVPLKVEDTHVDDSEGRQPVLQSALDDVVHHLRNPFLPSDYHGELVPQTAG